MNWSTREKLRVGKDNRQYAQRTTNSDNVTAAARMSMSDGNEQTETIIAT